MHLLTDRRTVLRAALTLAALRSTGAAAADPLLQPGIPLALARRRATQIARIGYAIALDLTGADRAAGSIEITFDRRAGSGDLVLDFCGPVLADLHVNGRAMPADARANGHLVLPESLLRTGANRVAARFVTPVAAADAAIVRFRDPTDGRTYLYTLLVPSDANLLFPYFDQPDLKARVRWQFTAPASNAALPIDVRRKVLTARDELALTVRIRRAAGGGENP